MAQNEAPDEQTTNLFFKRLVVGIILIVIGYSAVLIITTWPISRFSVEAAGTFGDSFGLLTSLFSGLAFAGLIWTILLQRVELKLQRLELQETRRQAILTRLMTVTQNQAAAFRTEISSLKFHDIIFSGEQIGIYQMLQTMNSHMETFAKENQEKDLSPDDHMEKIGDYLKSIFASIGSYQILIGGLKRCCAANRYLLSNESINHSEAQDIKSLLLSEMPTKLKTFIYQLEMALGVYLEIQTKATGRPADLFDPARGLRSDCKLILGHYSLKFTEESLQVDREQKWLFEA